MSFEIGKGESVALIGANGAGKSTLLGLVAGLAAPDEGTVSVTGRLAALLELGSGFHGDLTGRENVYLNGALLGLSRAEMKRQFDQIVDFSGVREFIDEPLRTYSSGMIVRLAFSVAIQVEPDILIVDEVLAVGDQSFQAKCLERIAAFQRSGNTLICVSHVPSAVQDLCPRAIWLDHGRVVKDGPSPSVIEDYTQGRLAAVGS
ncbi:MAG: ABC transporter ATP-binding protein [Bryobacteraceae bacterium]|nr:ABC transporter ATP-binding protein [Bryobacteraceae bacterium]